MTRACVRLYLSRDGHENNDRIGFVSEKTHVWGRSEGSYCVIRRKSNGDLFRVSKKYYASATGFELKSAVPIVIIVRQAISSRLFIVFCFSYSVKQSSIERLQFWTVFNRNSSIIYVKKSYCEYRNERSLTATPLTFFQHEGTEKRFITAATFTNFIRTVGLWEYCNFGETKSQIF